MSDVILYAAIKENERLQRELIELCAGGGGSFDYTQPAQDRLEAVAAETNSQLVLVL